LISAIVLAGGLGTRLRSVVPDLPKPMAPVSGRPFLEHLLDYWIHQKVQHFVLSVGYRHELIIDHLGANYKGAKIDYVIEEIPLGTGGGLLLGAQKIGQDKPFLVLNGDTYFAVNLEKLILFSASHKSDWCFSLFAANEVGRYMGMDISPQGFITSLKSVTAHSGRLANGGVYWVQPSALEQIEFLPGDKCSLEEDIFPTAFGLGQRMMGIEFPGPFIDIGVPIDYQRASEMLPLVSKP
jgi:D-glycero-alpha-D-manno-heptose 1-phosphate guanylyltransferase